MAEGTRLRGFPAETSVCVAVPEEVTLPKASMFERDKNELRELGVPLEVGRTSSFDSVDGYRVARQDYELGEIDLEPDEAAAVALASRLWESPELAGPAHGALLKLRAAGVEVDEEQGRVQPRVITADPAFGPLLSAVQTGRVVTFRDGRIVSDDRSPNKHPPGEGSPSPQQPAKKKNVAA